MNNPPRRSPRIYAVQTPSLRRLGGRFTLRTAHAVVVSPSVFAVRILREHDEPANIVGPEGGRQPADRDRGPSGGGGAPARHPMAVHRRAGSALRGRGYRRGRHRRHRRQLHISDLLDHRALLHAGAGADPDGRDDGDNRGVDVRDQTRGAGRTGRPDRRATRVGSRAHKRSVGAGSTSGVPQLGALPYIELGKHRGPRDFARVVMGGQRRVKGGRADR